MKKQILILWLVLISTMVYSQLNVDSLVQVGIRYHDDGQYNKAIEAYKTALEIEPNSPLVNYEIAMTYMSVNDYDNSIKHSDKVIELNDKYLLQTYILKGTCLDNMGKTEESISLFKKGIRKFGDHHLLYYNLGLNYYNLKEYDKAEDALTKAINTKPDHPSSHLLLGYVMANKNQKVKSILCLHYFLFLEPGSERSKTAYTLMQEQFSGNVEKNKENPKELTIYIDPNQSDSEFESAEMMISLLEVSKSLDENKEKSEDEMFIENTKSFFLILGELNKKKNKGLWWDFYVPIFYEFAQSGHIDTYCYYISQSSIEAAIEWLENNEKKTNEFGDWLKEQ